uniref:coiled-coil domain-containing protein 186-like n=1 Tax=Myxine glutinosa TaxID=7769 RepID=UPI00358F7544
MESVTNAEEECSMSLQAERSNETINDPISDGIEKGSSEPATNGDALWSERSLKTLAEIASANAPCASKREVVDVTLSLPNNFEQSSAILEPLISARVFVVKAAQKMLPNGLSSDLNGELCSDHCDLNSTKAIEALSTPVDNPTSVEDALLAELGLTEESLGHPLSALPNDLRKEARTASYQQDHHYLKARCSQQNETISRLMEEARRQQEHFGGMQAEIEMLKRDLAQSSENKQACMSALMQNEIQNKELQQHLVAAKERLVTQENTSKSSIAQLQQDFGIRFEQANRRCEDECREKEAMVMKYVRGEKEALDLRKDKESLERRLRDTTKEVEKLVGRLKQLGLEKTRLAHLYESRDTDMHKLNKEVERQKEEVTSLHNKLKLFQNKFNAEIDAHKETKDKLNDTTAKLFEAKEVSNRIQQNCQEIIKTYQDYKQVKSVTFHNKPKDNEEDLQRQKQETSNCAELQGSKIMELEYLKRNFLEGVDELRTLRTKVHCLEEERLRTEEELSKYREIINRQKVEIQSAQDHLRRVQELEEQLQSDLQEQASLQAEIALLNSTVVDLRQDVAGSREREAELLGFTERLSSKNAQLQSDANDLCSTVDRLSLQEVELRAALDEAIRSRNALAKDLESQQQEAGREASQLRVECSRWEGQTVALSRQVEELGDELSTQRRKNAANIKDLGKQLQQARRRLEQLETTHDNGGGGMGSRSSSSGSLNVRTGGSRDEGFSETAGSSPGTAEGFPEVDKAVLVERIVRLQKAHARKNEKLEFLEDHNQQLLEEVRRKARTRSDHHAGLVQDARAGPRSTCQASDSVEAE